MDATDTGVDEFLALVTADPELVRAEFEALIDAVWEPPPEPPAPRPAPGFPGPGTPGAFPRGRFRPDLRPTGAPRRTERSPPDRV
ncbi:hypothetical protein [Cryptosporangium japonicum]|uniref:Anti-sigma factor n=1 Tax=Cryptosporangium japonicum TaxID=80872 RepID=A0ABP3ET12_9ACTN